jgi:hypothetical protein
VSGPDQEPSGPPDLRVDLGAKTITCGPEAVRARRQVCYLADILLHGPDRGVTVESAIEAIGQQFRSDCSPRGRLNQLVGELRLAIQPLGWDVERIGGVPKVNLGRVRLVRAGESQDESVT